MAYNVLQDVRSIKNDASCRYDSLNGFDSTFPSNGNVEGWDVYSNTYLYGSWNKVLFGTSNANDCYIGRTDNILPIVADEYFNFKIMLKLTDHHNPYKDFPTQAKIQWITTSDNAWDENKSALFDIEDTDKWKLYTINLSEYQFWSGSVVNFRIYPFISGYPKIRFAIKYIRITSNVNYKCLNTQCDYYLQYSHPCQGIGGFSSITAGESATTYTTLSDVNDGLLVDIDNYGFEQINLGTNTNITGREMAKLISNKLSLIDIGAYAYSYAEHTTENKIKIISGNLGIANEDSLLSPELPTLYVQAFSLLKPESYFTALGLTIENPLPYLYLISGESENLLNLLYINDYDVGLKSVSETLVDNGIFSIINYIRSSSTFNFAQLKVRQYTGNYDACISLITTDTVVNMSVLISWYLWYSGNTYYRYFKDVTNDQMLLEDLGGTEDMFETEPAYYDIASNSLELSLVYAGAKIMVLVEGDEMEEFTVSFEGTYCSEKYSNIETIQKISNDFITHLYPYSGFYNAATIRIGDTPAAEVLGFRDTEEDSSSYIYNKKPASGFEFTSSCRLRANEINKLIDGKIDTYAYYHNPDARAVTAGRRDFFESTTANSSASAIAPDFYTKLDCEGFVIIDATHPIDNCGRINTITLNGEIYKDFTPSVMIFRPNKNGNLIKLYDIQFTPQETGSVYTAKESTYILTGNFLVANGDLIGVKNFGLYCLHSSITGAPNALLYKFSSGKNINTEFDPGQIFSNGTIGPSYYAYSTLTQENIRLNIDVGKRINLSNIYVYGKEFGTNFEYNVAACLDTNWTCELYNSTHMHSAVNLSTFFTSIFTHQNIAYGLESLSDVKITTEGGQQGQSYGQNNGLATYGTHSYFYVNGDTEWPQSSDGKSDFSTSWSSIETWDFEHDPLSLRMEFPEDEPIDILKSIIYFKEAPNFKRMSLSYYNGPHGEAGNAETYKYSYVPQYNYVSLDGIKHYSQDDSEEVTISDYILPNPMPVPKLKYVHGEATNSDLYQIAGSTEWNIIEHAFDPISCYGFNVFCDWHKSTKIIEMELYSFFSVEPSLVDNFVVTSSVYLDYWNDLVFYEDGANENKVFADVVGSPRYFSIDMAPQTECELYELKLELQENALKALNCEKTILIEDAPKYETTPTQSIVIENVYDKALNLYVGVPSQATLPNNILFWSTMSSENELLYPEIGPGVLVEKNEDLPLTLYDNQIAINCPGYYLNNLIDNKTAHVFEKNTYWREFGTLAHDEEINYYNDPDVHKTHISFDVATSKYWKFVSHDTDTSVLYTVAAYIEGTEVSIKTIYIQTQQYAFSNIKIPVELDTNGMLAPTTVLEDSFDNGMFIDYWGYNTPPGNFFFENINGLYPTALISGTESYIERVMTSPVNSFEFEVEFSADTGDYTTVSGGYARSGNILYVGVGETYTTIQSAIDASSMGDTVYVSPGEYTENITIDEHVHLYGTGDSPNEVTINGGNAAVIQIGAPLVTSCYNDQQVFFIENITFDQKNGTHNLFRITSGNEKTRLNIINCKLKADNASMFNCDASYMNVMIYNSELNEYVGTEAYFTNYDHGSISLYKSKLNRDTSFYSESDRSIFVDDYVITTVSGYGPENGYTVNNDFNYPVYNNSDSVTYRTELNSSDGLTNLYLEATIVDDFVTLDIVSENRDKANEPSPYNVDMVYFTDTYYLPFIHSLANSFRLNITREHAVITDVKFAAFDNCWFFTSQSYTICFTSRINSTKIIYRNNETNINLTNVIGMKTYSTFIKALPILSSDESIILELDSSDPMDEIKLVSQGDKLENLVVYTAVTGNNDFIEHVRNFGIANVAYENRAILISDVYTNPPWDAFVFDHGLSEGFSIRYVSLPQWFIYDFGAGNEKCIDKMYMQLNAGDSSLPDILRIYGSNDPEMDWNSKSKVLLSEVSTSPGYKSRYYRFSNVNYYRYYCLYFPWYSGASSSVSIPITRLQLLDSINNNLPYFFTATYLWYQSAAPVTGNSIDMSDGILEFVKTSTTQNDTMRMTSNFIIDGDLDIQTDWQVNTYLEGNRFQARLRVQNENDSGTYIQTLLFRYYNSTQLRVDKNTGWVAVLSSDERSQNKFRIKRIGNSWTFYFYNYDTEAWDDYTRTFSHTLSDRVRISFDVWIEDGFPAIDTYFTNFRVNSGNIIWGSYPGLDLLTPTYGIYDNYFAIDLGMVYRLDFLRSYGDVLEKLYLPDLTLEYASTETDNPNNVVWDSDKYSARWIKITLFCGDGNTRMLQYLGIYPDTSTAYGEYGGYNCDWKPLGNVLSSYNYSYNLTGSGIIDTQTEEAEYYLDFSPYKCISGDNSLSGMDNCWAFTSHSNGTEPAFILDLREAFYIDSFKLFHSYDDYDVDTWQNTSYTIYGKKTLSDDFVNLIEVTGNSDSIREHSLLTPVLIRYIRLEINSFSKPSIPIRIYDEATEENIYLDGGFVREFEVRSASGSTIVNSEFHPVVCIDLKDQFNVSGHKLITNDTVPGENISWDNEEQFFKYSDNSSDNPNQVSFLDSDSLDVIVAYSNELIDQVPEYFSMSIEESVYLAVGYYTLDWETYGAETEEVISISILGPNSIERYSKATASSWASQYNTFSINEDGYYSISANKVNDDILIWGIRNLYIKRSSTNSKWVLVKRDTATEYSWDNDSNKYGIDYLNTLKIFGSRQYLPTEKNWWWASTLSTLSSEHLKVKRGASALKINYPTSSGIDRLDFIEGDCFGWDENWSVKDTLSFWWYISDLNNLYIDEGGFGFGSFYGADNKEFVDYLNNSKNITAKEAIYTWDFKDMVLQTGWNYMKLQFDRNNVTNPVTSLTTGLMEKDLDFQNNFFTSFGMVYRGVGSSFYMILDDLKIERNDFNDEVKFGKNGLCLTNKEYASVPIAGLTPRKGAIEMRLKLYTSTAGEDVFGYVKSRTIFTVTNNNNEMVSLSIKSAGWFEIGFGGARYDYNILYMDPRVYDMSSIIYQKDATVHVAMVWSNDGTGMTSTDTMRLYINNLLVIATKDTWEVHDSKSAVLRLGGGTTVLANNNDADGSAIFSNVKVYDYCKEEFEINSLAPVNEQTYNHNSLLKVSKNNIDFYDINSGQLPLKFEEIAPADKVTIYIQVDKTNIDLIDKKTGTLDIEWQVIV